jgi:hypothetical protein
VPLMRDHPALEVESGWAFSIDQRPVDVSMIDFGAISASVLQK